MNKDTKARLTELKKISRIPKEILGLSEAYLTNEAVKLLMDAMVSEGLDELILVACDPNGNPLDSWDCDEDFKFDANDIVNFSHNEIIVTPKIKYYNDIAFGVITRFGIYNTELMYHATNVVIHKDGDLSYGDTEKENWQEDWLPVSDIEDQTKIRKLIFKCLSSKCEGIWRFTKEHPECRFLNRVLNNDMLTTVIAASNGKKDLSGLFSKFKHLKKIDLSELNTSNAISLQGFFFQCTRLRTVDFSKSDTKRCVTFESLLDGCISLTEACFGGNFSTCNATSFKEMFRDCSSLTSLNLSSFDTLKVRDLNMMFYGCSSLVTLDLNNWDLNNRQTYSDMFSGCVNLSKIYLKNVTESTILVISNALKEARLNNVEIIAELRSSIEIDKIDDSITDVDFDKTIGRELLTSKFRYLTIAKQLNFNGFDMGNVVDGRNMFSDCVNLESITLEGLNFSHVKDMGSAFSGCERLKSVSFKGIDTSMVMDWWFMFKGCKALEYVDMTGIDTSRCMQWRGVFQDCSNLTYLNLSGLDVSRTTDMRLLFSGCVNLEKLDLSEWNLYLFPMSWDTFSECNKLKTVILKGCDKSTIQQVKDAISSLPYCIEKRDISRITFITD